MAKKLIVDLKDEQEAKDAAEVLPCELDYGMVTGGPWCLVHRQMSTDDGCQPLPPVPAPAKDEPLHRRWYGRKPASGRVSYPSASVWYRPDWNRWTIRFGRDSYQDADSFEAAVERLIADGYREDR